MLRDIGSDLDVELDDAVHCYCDCDPFDDHDPDVGKCWVERLEAVAIKVLCNDGGDGHADSDEAVLEDCDPDDVEPGESASRRPQPAVLSPGAFLEPSHGPNPWLRLDGPKIFLLVVEVGREICAH